MTKKVSITDPCSIFIVWEGANEKLHKIEASLASQFNLLSKITLNWTDANYFSNIDRLYTRPNQHRPLKDYSKKFGRPPYNAFVVRDSSPDIGYIQTTSGEIEFGNRNFLNAKREFRQGLSHPYLIHCTTTQEEFEFQARLIFGHQRVTVDANFGDLYGSGGWADLDEMFAAINPYCRFCVLRAPNENDLGNPNFDLDILTDDFQRFASLSNVRQRRDKPFKGTVQIGKHNIRVDIRFVGDGYHPEHWQLKMLEGREARPGGLFLPKSEDRYFSLLYHCLLHKGYISQKYFDDFIYLEAELCAPWKILEMDKSAQIELLRGYLSSNRYFSRLAVDIDVGFNRTVYNQLPRAEDHIRTTLKKHLRAALRRLRSS